MSNINIKLPLGRGSLGFFDMNNDTRSAVKENVKITILTNIGERVVSDVGSSISLDVFENNENIRDSLFVKFQDMFSRFFNFLNLDDVIVITSEENNSLNNDQVIVTIKYSFKGVDNFQDEISVLLG